MSLVVGCRATEGEPYKDFHGCRVKCIWLENLVNLALPLHVIIEEIDCLVGAWML